MKSRSLLPNPNLADATQIDPDPDPPQPNSTSSPDFLWSNLFADSVSSNAPSSSPSYLPDGTPVVLAPPSTILKASSNWTGHLLCRFLGEPPSPAKFFNDLNRVGERHGDISVRRFSSGTFLVHVPSPSTSKWIFQTGLWSSGMVSFVVSEWSVNPSLAPPPKLTSATTVLTIREIPPQLWSHEGVATIAGGVAKLIPGTRASLPLSSLGTATIRAIVPLGSPLSPSVLVKDFHGDSVLIPIEYGRLPPLCSSCNSYGHQLHRCPSKHSTRQSLDSMATPNSSKPISNLEKNSESASTLVQAQKLELQRKSMDIDNVGSHSSSSLPKPSIQSTEAVVQVMELDNMACEDGSPSVGCEETLSKCISDCLPVSASNPPSTDELCQVQSSSPQECSQSLLDPLDISTSSPITFESLAGDISLTNPCKEHSPKLSTIPESTLPSFSFPPPVTHALGPLPLNTSSVKPLPQVSETVAQVKELDNLAFKERVLECVSDLQSVLDSSPTSSDPSLIQHSLMEKSSAVKKVMNRDKSKDKLATNSFLGCKSESHKFKPKGIVEKRRKKAQNELLPDDEEVFECIQEMKSEKKNSTYYEALHAHKILRKLDSDTNESLET